MSFAELDLDPTIEQAISDLGFETPTEIQEQAIPIALDGSDLLATAPTGTGKTIAFCAPAVQHILDRDEQSTTAPKVLILAPSRELARQIFNVVELLTQHTRIQSHLIIGGTPYGMQQQQLSELCDILVATPGRLVELDEKQWLDLTDVSYFVIDEADRMLDMGFVSAINHIAKELPQEHQTLMFSATLEGEKMGRFASALLNSETQQIRLGESSRTVPNQIRQIAYRVDSEEHKEAVLKHLLTQERVQQAVLFVSNREHVDIWVQRIRNMGLMCDGLHGEMKQGDRSEHMKQMKRGRLQVLVATDVASRGIDLPEINTVINLRLPRKADSYIHRAGRASREGAPGDCISLIDINDLPMIEKIQRFMQANIKFGRIEGLEAKTKARSPSAKKNKKKKPTDKKSAAKK
ncbi:DEAD/DEAH box helicase [Marinomonas sp. A79]|uniref:DEAD/DEAH box helicase n=1 Tax=Marinomonas vulgaris TaxID=2823372 RepID=A0ABS5HE42_9GAMM|nr:DEAD/DEAH box helicase [Marinomonas vulgaris]MBR7889886.1 DEAD/DEAH box helicase [Marinomonas vulgaris]